MTVCLDLTSLVQLEKTKSDLGIRTLHLEIQTTQSVTDRQTDNQIDRHTDILTDKHTDRQTY